jgi:hypothetical protein
MYIKVNKEIRSELGEPLRSGEYPVVKCFVTFN